MESGNSNDLNRTAEPVKPAPADWRNYRSGSHDSQKNNETPVIGTPRKRDGNGTAIGLAVFGLIIGIIGCAVGGFALFKTFQQPTVISTTSAEGYYTGNSTEFESSSIASIASKVTPAVVSIVSEGYSSSYYGLGGLTQSAGTGMIVSADGYVVTNKHVVNGSRKIRIITDDGTTYDNVKLLGTDPLNDVAYLKISGAKNLPTITLGDSKTIAVGQPVLAIGNALGAYQNTVTQGIISGTGRSVAASDSSGGNVEYLADLLQTDAAINPGNSGGPLVNAAGDVIGINTATSTSAEGLGFAIPISAVKGMLKRIQDDGKAERAYIGLSYITITAEIAKKYDLKVKQGAYVYNEGSTRSSAIVKGGPADKAGIKDKDIITKVGNVEVGRAGSISTLVGEYKVGETIQITLIRDGKERVANVTLEAYKE
ncbi:trypsin-like peptidase domain-containing protein [Candidatus Saccharibacteria bacterium]|nr:trypsin-like peptidase domain-containing protein [Candidatus Saccharibacteria bacterium]